jgi:ppGpp synthetase/RelA/SpoT-type nucleotidyltranferase
MTESKPTAEHHRHFDELVAHYLANQGPIKRFLDSLHGFISDSAPLAHLTHSTKRRMKSATSLKDKLIREWEIDTKAGVAFHINSENLFTEITDLGGYRILHLHTRQMDQINKAFLAALVEAQSTVVEGPKANVWDNESEAYFKSIGIQTEYNPRMYSSVHYTVMPNNGAQVRVEIQVRTLSEEIWGEVDHKFNYPHAIDSVSCGEQIKVLARVASSCTRLVDSIFASYADWEELQQVAAHTAAEAVDTPRIPTDVKPIDEK